MLLLRGFGSKANAFSIAVGFLRFGNNKSMCRTPLGTLATLAVFEVANMIVALLCDIDESCVTWCSHSD
jgi:hypothetical protein